MLKPTLYTCPDCGKVWSVRDRPANAKAPKAPLTVIRCAECYEKARKGAAPG